MSERCRRGAEEPSVPPGCRRAGQREGSPSVRGKAIGAVYVGRACSSDTDGSECATRFLIGGLDPNVRVYNNQLLERPDGSGVGGISPPVRGAGESRTYREPRTLVVRPAAITFNSAHRAPCRVSGTLLRLSTRLRGIGRHRSFLTRIPRSLRALDGVLPVGCLEGEERDHAV